MGDIILSQSFLGSLGSQEVRGTMTPDNNDPDAGAEYLVNTGEISKQELFKDETLEELRAKIERTWDMFRHM